MTFQPRHLLVAVVLHLLLFGMMAGGAQCTRKVPVPLVIEAVLYDPSRQQLEDKKKVDEQRRRREAEEAKRRQAQAEAKAKEEALRREEQEKKQAADEQARKKAQDLEKKKADELAKKKAEEQAKTKAEQDRQKKEQQEKRERQEQEKRAAEMRTQMQREIEQENLRRQMDQEAQALRQSEMNARIHEWGARVTAHIRKNWIRPAGSAEDFDCTVQVQLLPDGTVTIVRIVRSCGTAVLNKSVEDAVYRSSPIPRPDDPAVFQRELTINFKPR